MTLLGVETNINIFLCKESREWDDVEKQALVVGVCVCVCVCMYMCVTRCQCKDHS